MRTIIGIFDHMHQAQQARERLLQAQLPQEHVHVGAGHLGPDGELVTDNHAARRQRENRNVLAAFGSFWANLIESHAHSQALEGALQRGHAVVLAQVATDEQAAMAAKLFEDCQALEVQHGQVQPEAGGVQPQPWHPADERAASAPAGKAPLGTHSLTGGGAEVGQPQLRQERVAEHGTASREPERSGVADLLGRRPDANRER